MKKWFENLKISKKLIIGFLFVAFLGIITGVIGIMNMESMVESQQSTYDECTMGIKHSSSADINFFALGKSMSLLALNYNDIDARSQYVEKCEQYITGINSSLESYEKTISTDEDQTNFDALKEFYDEYIAVINENLSIAKAGSAGAYDKIITNITKSATLSANTTKAFETLTEYNYTFAQQDIDRNKDSSSFSIGIMITITAISFIFALLLSIYISGLISKPMHMISVVCEHLAVGDIDTEGLIKSGMIKEEDKHVKDRKDEIGTAALGLNKLILGTVKLSREMETVATGDLTAEVTVRSEKDIMGKALRELVDKFHELAASIVSSANQVDSGAKQVADSSTALSQGATEQASSVEELTTSLEEITSQTAENTQNAQTANEFAKSIKKDAETGNTQMKEMLHAMDEINSSSDNINKIIKVIEDIAFQTNILALNAAVEAARAGQYGKGFAVVAEEVRNLAAKSANAAKETTSLIDNSIKKVNSGTKIANDTAVALEKIVEGISKTTELIDSIATSSTEQSTALEQINQGITQVSQVVQSNAASAEECAASSEELSGQADSLKNNVSIFKLNTAALLSSAGSTKQQPKAKQPTPENDKKNAAKAGNKTICLSENEFGKY